MCTLRVGLGLALAAALAVAPALTACSGAAKEEPVAEEQTTAAPVKDVADDQSEAEDTTAASDAIEMAAADDGTVDAGDFSFTIPEYWRGRVSCDQSDVDGSAMVVVTLPGNPEATLATLMVVDGPEPETAGDISYHLAGFAKGGDVHVEVWTSNWPWLAASGDIEGLSPDEVSELVDLSTGGALSYKDVVSASPDDVGKAEYDFMSSTLVPTVAFG